MCRAVRCGEASARGHLFPVASSPFAQIHSIVEIRHIREGGSNTHDLRVSEVLWDIQV